MKSTFAIHHNGRPEKAKELLTDEMEIVSCELHEILIRTEFTWEYLREHFKKENMVVGRRCVNDSDA